MRTSPGETAVALPGPSPTSLLRGLGDRLVFWAVMGTLLLCCLGWSVPALLLGRLLPRRMRAPFGQYTAMLWCRAFIAILQATRRVQTDLTAIDALRGQTGIIIAANHPCLLDAILIISRLPRVLCIAKADLWDSLFFGAGIRVAGYLRNDSPRAVLRGAAAALRGHQEQLLIFPEGTRTVAPPVGPFHPGFAAIARRAGAPVQVVLVETNSPYLGKSWPLLRRPQFPLTYRLRLGPRLSVASDPQGFTAELERIFAAELTGAA